MRFDDLMNETVETTVRQILGEGAGQALMFHLGAKPSTSDGLDFSRSLRRIVGKGAPVVETLILRSLYERIGMRYSEDLENSFEQQVRRARENFGERSGAA
jgi:hypothetical protein